MTTVTSASVAYVATQVSIELRFIVYLWLTIGIDSIRTVFIISILAHWHRHRFRNILPLSSWPFGGPGREQGSHRTIALVESVSQHAFFEKYSNSYSNLVRYFQRLQQPSDLSKQTVPSLRFAKRELLLKMQMVVLLDMFQSSVYYYYNTLIRASIYMYLVWGWDQFSIFWRHISRRCLRRKQGDKIGMKDQL
jgi:hypothetical protein